MRASPIPCFPGFKSSDEAIVEEWHRKKQCPAKLIKLSPGPVSLAADGQHNFGRRVSNDENTELHIQRGPFGPSYTTLKEGIFLT